jgi:S1-C subfamily serine protease
MRVQERPRPAPQARRSEDSDTSSSAPRKQNYYRKQSNKGPLIAILATGGGVALLLLIVIGVGLVFLLNPGSSATTTKTSQVASNGQDAGPKGGGGGGAPIAQDAPEAPPLRYQWLGSPNIYHVRVEAEMNDHTDIHEGNATINASPGRHIPVQAAEGKGSGTGFVVNSDGYLLTCAHVVADAKKIDVTIGDRTYPGKVVVVNRPTDMAIVKIAAQGLPTLSLGDSDRVEIGQDVWALGFPLSDRLGQSLKVNRGTLSGITSRAGKKLLQIDASVNPGNSGGPLVSETGIVLGVVSAKMIGEDISNVAVAGPSNDAKRLLSTRNIAFSTDGWDTKLEGPTLVKRVSVATAYIEVTIGESTDSDLFVLKTNGLLSKNQVFRGGGIPFPRPPAFTPAENGSMEIDGSGRIIYAKGGLTLPYLLGDIPQFLIDPLPDDGRQTWESSASVTIYEKSGSPRGFGAPGFPRMPRNPFGPRFPGGGRDADEGKTRPGSEHAVYTRTDGGKDVVTIRKQYELRVPATAQSPVAITLAGAGEIKFDTKLGVPREIKFDAKLSESGKGQAEVVPISITCTLIVGEERDKLLHPPAQPAAPANADNPAGKQPAGQPNNNGQNRAPRIPGQAAPPENRQRDRTLMPPIHGRIGPLPKITGDAPKLKTADASILFGSPARRVVAGGGDKYLIVHLPAKNELSIVDLKEAKIVKSIPVADADVLFAAGMDDLIVYLPSTKQFQRWSFKTLSQTGTAASPIGGEIMNLALGSASNGPLVVHAPTEDKQTLGIVLLDPANFKRLPDSIDPIKDMPLGIDIDPNLTCISCSPDGNVIVLHSKPLWNQAILHREGQRWLSATIKGNYPLPSSDGQSVIDHGQSFALDGKSNGPSRYQLGRAVWCVPSLMGMWTLSMTEAKETAPSRDAYLKLTLHVGTDPVPTISIPFRSDSISQLVDWQFGRYPAFEQHVFLAPNSGKLAVIPATDDRIEFYRLKMDELMKTATGDFIIVTSKPPADAKRGVELHYQLTAKSKNGGLTYHLNSGPAGAKLTASGILTWTPPAGNDEEIVSFSIAVRDKTGHEVSHTFQLRLAPK